MTPTTREHALAAMKQAGLEKRVDMDSLFRFWSLAMERAAGICEARSRQPNDGCWTAEEWQWRSACLEGAAQAIREAGSDGH